MKEERRYGDHRRQYARAERANRKRHTRLGRQASRDCQRDHEQSRRGKSKRRSYKTKRKREGSRRRGRTRSQPTMNYSVSPRKGRHSHPWRHPARDQNNVEKAEGDEAGYEKKASALFLDNIDRDADERAVRWLLRMDNSISRLFISKKHRHNNKLAFAIVEMVSAAHVQQAVERLNGRIFMGHKIFARKAKYAMKVKDNAGVAGRLMKKQSGTAEPPPQNGLSKCPLQAPVCGENEGKLKVGGDGAEQDGADAVEVVVSGACVEGGDARLEKEWSLKSRARLRVVVHCCCRPHNAVIEEESLGRDSDKNAAAQKVLSDNQNNVTLVGRNEGAGCLGNIAQFVPWSGTHCTGWAYPQLGYWPSWQMQGIDQFGWWGHPSTWGQMQGWGGDYNWPYATGMVWSPPGYSQPNPPRHDQNVHGGSNEIVNQGAVDHGLKAPVSIRKTLNVRVLDTDPVMEDIVRNVRETGEEVAMSFDKMGSDAEVGARIGICGEDKDALFIRTNTEQADPHAQMLEEEEEDLGLTNLFEDPEFPPGFEPNGGSHHPETDPEESFVKEEARQTLILAKKIGCTVLDEERALSNIEEIIREQRTSYRQRCQDSEDMSKDDSDGCARTTSKEKSRKTPGTRPLGFSKMSRVSKIAMRGKKKSK